MLISRSRLGLILVVGLLVLPRAVSLVNLSAASASSTEAEAVPKGGAALEDLEIREIIAQPTLHRQMPRIRFLSDRRTYEFLASHPPLSSQIAKRLYPQLEGYKVTRIEQGVYTIEDGSVLRGEARLIAATGDQHIYRFQGEFRSLANLLHFTGRMVVIFRYREVRDGSRSYVDSDPNFYLRIDHLLFHVITKLLSPAITSIVDRRVKMIVEASHKLFDQIRTDPDGLYQQMSMWPEVHPEDLEAFRQVFLSRGVAMR